MKDKIIKLFLVVGLVTSLIGCNDELDQTPYDGLTDDQLFSTEAGFKDAMKGVYSAFRIDGIYGQNLGLQICPDVISDNLIACSEGRQTQRALFQLINTAENESFALYWSGYKLISRANRVIDNIEKLSNDDLKKQYLAEARAIRAMLHFDIARTYCQIPTQSANANSSLGIYYAKKYQPTEKPRRVGTTVKGTYDEIVADLEYAATNLGKSTVLHGVTKNTVNAVLSRVYLYMGNYEKVIEVANRITNVPIASKDNFAKVWTDEYFENVLFSVIFTEQDGDAIGNVYSQSSEAGVKSEFVVSYPLFLLYKDTDIRKSAYISTSDFAGHSFNHVAKYFGKPNKTRNLVYGKYIRMEEVLLNQAEAYQKKGNNAKALELLNKLRKERYTPYTDGTETGVALEDAIQLERRLELAFEGDRFYTLKRRGENMDRGNYGDYADGTGMPVVAKAQKMLANDHRWLLPIPQGAFDANSNLTKEDQNPGY